MIKLNVKNTKLNASCIETLVAGNVNSIFAEFSFSHEWDELDRIAVFSNGTAKLSVPLSENICAIPWETLSCPGELIVAVRGIGNGGSTVLCTENASLGKVNETLADCGGDTPLDASPGVIDSLIGDVRDLMESGIAPAPEVFTAIYGQTSFNDILAAYNSGKKIQVRRETGNSKYIYDLSYIYSEVIRFGQITNSRIYSCSVTGNNVWSYDSVLYSDYYVKPSGGIPASDLSDSVISTIVSRVLSELEN